MLLLSYVRERKHQLLCPLFVVVLRRQHCHFVRCPTQRSVRRCVATPISALLPLLPYLTNVFLDWTMVRRNVFVLLKSLPTNVLWSRASLVRSAKCSYVCRAEMLNSH